LIRLRRRDFAARAGRGSNLTYSTLSGMRFPLCASANALIKALSV
jgi:hypothetical protein